MALVGFATAGPSRASATVGAPEYYAVTIKTHSFNMCSVNVSGCGSAGGYTARNLITWFEATDGPWTIAVQEACAIDIQALSNTMGLPAHFFPARNYVSGCPPHPQDGSKAFGNAVFRTGSLAAPSALAFRFPTQRNTPCNPNVHACRVAVCAPMNSYAGVLNTCSAHLEGFSVPDFSEPQAAEYIYWVNSTFSSGGKIMAGDFNLLPGDMPGAFYTGYWRAPQANTSTAANPIRQYDYIWHDRAHSLNNLLLSPHCDPYYSDHCYAFAKFQ